MKNRTKDKLLNLLSEIAVFIQKHDLDEKEERSEKLLNDIDDIYDEVSDIKDFVYK